MDIFPFLPFLICAVMAIAILICFSWGGRFACPCMRPVLRQGPGRRRKTPLEILEGRFVRGEIDKEEFENRRQVLSEQRPHNTEAVTNS